MDAGIASLAATRAGGGGGLDETDTARAAVKETNGGCWQKTNKQNKQANNPDKKLEKKIKNTWWKSNNAIKVFSL